MSGKNRHIIQWVVQKRVSRSSYSCKGLGNCLKRDFQSISKKDFLPRYLWKAPGENIRKLFLAGGYSLKEPVPVMENFLFAVSRIYLVWQLWLVLYI